MELLHGRKLLSFFRTIINFYLYSAVVKFFVHSISYILFLVLFSYVTMDENFATTEISDYEILLIICVVTHFVQEVYQVIRVDSSDPFASRLKDYLVDPWNISDITCMLYFLVALVQPDFQGPVTTLSLVELDG